MTFNTEKFKLQKLWDKVEDNTNLIIEKQTESTFIIDHVEDLNRLNQFQPILRDFSSDWITPTIITELNSNDEEIIAGNFQEFRLTFNTTNDNFLPFIHAEVMYRVGESGVIPDVDGVPFDEDIADSNRLQKSEIFQKTNSTIEYISFVRMDFSVLSNIENPEVQYKFICYLMNPSYYQSS